MKLYIIAGEASGDLHGSNLIKALHKEKPGLEIRCWGGEKMQDAGAELVKHYRDLAFMGFVEVLLNIRTIIKNIAFCKEDILSYKPDALVLIDYPGFNMRIAEFAKKEGIPVYYYISPQVWAWKQNRVFKLQRDVNRLFCILPFEKDFFAKFGMEVDFVGHPLLDVVAEHKNLASNNNFRNKHKLNDKPVIALLPGSRKQEIKVMLPLMLSVVKSFPEYQFVIGAAPSQDSVFYQNLMRDFPEVKLIENDTYGLMANASAGLVTSGTATLEAALWSMPEVVCYKGNVFSYQIAKRLIKVKYISLVNLVMDREVVRELIQDDLNQKMIQNSLQEILPGGSRRTGLMADYQELSTALGGNGASSKTASMLLRNLECHLLSRKV
jgi:lipid-A-disaccharide synthase